MIDYIVIHLHVTVLLLSRIIIILFIGIRLLGEYGVVDSQEAASLNHLYNKIHVYSNSWGPSDDGYTVYGPGRLVKDAFINGVNKVLLLN